MYYLRVLKGYVYERGKKAMQITDTQDDFRQTVERYKSVVFACAYSRLRNKSEADDVFQETFLLYYGKTLNFENEAARKAWLIRTALNLCKKKNLSSWATRVERLDESGELIDEGASALTKEENEVLGAVMELKEKLRVPVYLYYFSGLSIEEIAQTLGIKSGAVQVRLVRARKELKNKLKGEYFHE